MQHKSVWRRLVSAQSTSYRKRTTNPDGIKSRSAPSVLNKLHGLSQDIIGSSALQIHCSNWAQMKLDFSTPWDAVPKALIPTTTRRRAASQLAYSGAQPVGLAQPKSGQSQSQSQARPRQDKTRQDKTRQDEEEPRTA